MSSHTDTDPKKLAKAWTSHEPRAPVWLKQWHVPGNKAAALTADSGAEIHKVAPNKN